MNREQKRAFVKKAQKKGVDKNAAKAYAEIISNGGGTPNPPQEIIEGEKIKLDLDKIKNRRNYAQMSEKYKEFVNANSDTIFTAHVERPSLISLAEEPKWLFWSGDLIKVEQEVVENVCINQET